MAIQSFAEFFGCDDYDVFKAAQDAKDTAEGYLAGTTHAAVIQQMIIDEYANYSRAYREAVAKAIREQL